MKTIKLGLIVNPIAGMGGKVGLKGTDDALNEAVSKGAEPIAPRRAIEFLQKLKEKTLEKKCKILTCPGIMGEEEARTTNFTIQVLPMKIKQETSAEDTKTATKLLTTAGVDLIVFAGGDGTARDVLDALKDFNESPVLGVPCGVKMYSGIFAVSPSDAADVVLAFVEGHADITEFEVMDVDEKAIRKDVFAVKLYGYLKGPFLPAHIQGSKQVSPETTDEVDNQTAIARFIIEGMQPNGTYILGAGTTVKRLAELLGVRKTILGVDIYRNERTILDVNEERLLKEVTDWLTTWIILSPIGHQGILLGRGNQQISPQIIKKVGKERIIVAATKSKLHSIEGNILRVDTGDCETDNILRGYIRVVTDYREWRLMQVL
ncbi:ATP-NAD kinase family protein [Candidatus Bathyarchaeota archaeon]|nr:ATP-NAD kinase family protein [Candidatus Bathyarchaeota archaeon]